MRRSDGRAGRSGRLTADAAWWIGTSIAAVAAVAVQTPLTTAVYAVPVAVAFALTVLHAGALPLAVRHPIPAAVLSVVVSAALLWVSNPAAAGPWPWPVATELTQLAVVLVLALRAAWQIASATLTAAVAASIVLALVRGSGEGPAVNVVVFASIGAGVLGAGIAVREWRRIREQLIGARRLTAEEESRRVIAEEKARLAREFHDVIAHSMSVINVQAVSAPSRLGGLEPRVADEFADIGAQARTALREMRALLQALRDDESAGPVQPQQRLADIAVLVRQTVAAGADVHLEWVGPKEPSLTALADLAGYRVAQEGLSNALRHAPGAAVTVRVEVDDRTARVGVHNDAGAVAATPVPGGGHGLATMRDRVVGAGGTVATGPRPDGGYSVVAVLPLSETEESR